MEFPVATADQVRAALGTHPFTISDGTAWQVSGGGDIHGTRLTATTCDGHLWHAVCLVDTRKVMNMPIQLSSLATSDHSTDDLVRTTTELNGTESPCRYMHVNLVQDAPQSLASETADLLRRRLIATAWALVCGLGAFLISKLFAASPTMVGLRLATFASALICLIWLRASVPKSLTILKWNELLLLSIVGIQTVGLQVTQMSVAASDANATAMNLSMLFAFATWSILILAYAIFIPNTWQRAAAILIPSSCIPLVVTWCMRLLDDHVVSLLRLDEVLAASLLTFVATGAAVLGTHTVTALRRRAYFAQQFGQYRLKQRLATGGMGEIYLAEHCLLKRPSAIKLIRPGLDTRVEAIARFEREVQAAARLSHWNTVEIFDYGRTHDGVFYYVMEYLDGCNLEELVTRHGPMPPGRVVYFLRQICHALHEAHANGLIHGDIKPANIFSAFCGGQYDVAKLLDFGLVQESMALVPLDTNTPAARVRIMGTPRYMAPEQIVGQGLIGIHSDIYSLGATAYQLLTGQPPFTDTTVAGLIKAHVAGTVLPPSQLEPAIPGDVEAIVLRCLAKNPSDRFADVDQILAALAECSCCDTWSTRHAEAWWLHRDAIASPVLLS